MPSQLLTIEEILPDGSSIPILPHAEHSDSPVRIIDLRTDSKPPSPTCKPNAASSPRQGKSLLLLKWQPPCYPLTSAPFLPRATPPLALEDKREDRSHSPPCREQNEPMQPRTPVKRFHEESRQVPAIDKRKRVRLSEPRLAGLHDWKLEVRPALPERKAKRRLEQIDLESVEGNLRQLGLAPSKTARIAAGA
ncbi:MAG: hypothetical protein SGPRY_007609 [Prymnesium sp.]